VGLITLHQVHLKASSSHMDTLDEHMLSISARIEL
jgi:hypothetical protein